MFTLLLLLFTFLESGLFFIVTLGLVHITVSLAEWKGIEPTNRTEERSSLIFMRLAVLFLGHVCSKNIESYLYLVVLFSLLFFMSDNLLILYLSFEAGLLPVILLIYLWGGQPERSSAFYFFLGYRLRSSYPLLVTSVCLPSIELNLLSGFRRSLFYFILLGFLVKIPLYLFHLWLPKAHVEAPSLGSILLAGLLLKLGSWGIYRLSSLLRTYISFMLETLAIRGMFIGAMIATLQRDTKSLVAYSRVCHINFIVYILIMAGTLSKRSSVVIMVTHGVTSSVMFWITGIRYYAKYSRQIFFVSFLMGASSALTIMISVLFFSNFAVPPTVAFSQEVFFLLRSLVSSPQLLGLMIVYLLLVVYFTLYYLVSASLPFSRAVSSNSIRETTCIIALCIVFNTLLIRLVM